MKISLYLRSVLIGLSICLTLPAVIVAQESNIQNRLNGAHFRITAIAEAGFLDIQENENEMPNFSGFLIKMIEGIARQANFTYELLPPSGTGSLCVHDPEGFDPETQTYGKRYRGQYNCGQSDVTDPLSNYTTDMYLGMFLVTSERQELNHFSLAFHPPTTGALAMVGTATHIRSFDDLIEQQKSGKQKPVCVIENTAYSQFLELSFPELQIVPIAAPSRQTANSRQSYIEAIRDGICGLHVLPYPGATRLVLGASQDGDCLVNEMPLGIIGEPLNFGPSQFAIGIHKSLSIEVVETINYYLNIMMSCPPTICDSLANHYPYRGAGDECGYVQFPPPDRMSGKTIALIVVGCTSLVIIVLSMFYYWRLRRQRKRFKKRFVQQIARNIAIGPSPGCIPAEKLAEQVELIGGTKGRINKHDLAVWMNDVKLSFLSESDFDALWNAIDIERKGYVDPIEFILFMGMCGTEFKEVYSEIDGFSKMEKLKWAARRLTNIHNGGEENVRRIENKIERTSRNNIHLTSSQMRGSGNGGSRVGSKTSDLDSIAEAIAKCAEEGTLDESKRD